MPLTIEATYHDGVVELKEKPKGINNSRALVILLDSDTPAAENRRINWQKVQKKQSTVDKWIGVLEGKDLGDWKEQKRDHIEGKPK